MNTNGFAAVADRTPTLTGFDRIETPGTAQEVADLLRQCAASGACVVPVGGGGALQIGNPAQPDAIGLSTRQPSQILDYQPTDMTLSVGAGATLAAVQEELGAHGQALPIEAVDSSVATIGGLVATALSGPRRYGAGTLRDVLIGIAVAYPDGSVAKAGGLVVKNVSGFDMMRLHYGALGTLGVIVSANFKVLPTIRDEFTIEWLVPSLTEAGTLVAQLRAPAVRPMALVVSKEDDSWTIRARYEGRPGGLRAVAKALEALNAEATKVEGAESAAVWHEEMASRAFRDPNEVRVRAGCLPASTIATAHAMQATLDRHGIVADRVTIEPGVGLVYLSWTADEPMADAACLAATRSVKDVLSCTVLTAPDDLKTQIDVWGSEPESIEIMRSLKAEFDPAGVLNRSRFAGRI